VAAMCAESHQYRPLPIGRGGGIGKSKVVLETRPMVDLWLTQRLHSRYKQNPTSV
jgi:hypothetical protein